MKRKTAQRAKGQQPDTSAIRWMILSADSGLPIYQSDLGKPVEERGMEYDQAIRWADELLSETVLVPAFIYWDFPNPEEEETEE